MTVTVDALDIKNEAYDKEYWLDLDALYRGGKALRNRIKSFLVQNPMEPEQTYHQRIRESNYRSYMGPIIDYYAAWLFSSDFKVRPSKTDSGETIEKVDPAYSQLREDVGGDVDMTDFLHERFTRALIDQRSHWLCEIPAAREVNEYPANKAEWLEAGFRKGVQLRKVDAAELYDWELGPDAKLDWCVTHTQAHKRGSIVDVKRLNIETWHVYDREFCTVYEITYKDGERPRGETEVPPKVVYKHGFNEVPLVTLQIPEGLWIANRVRDPQCEHFRMSSALSWSIKRTCYSMPVFNVEDKESPPQTMGTGYYIMIGKEEKFGWSAPPAGQFDVISKEVDTQRNEMFRMTNQMSLGLDNNAETVGRSADSKEADNAATRIMLNAYGGIVSKSIEETFEIVSDAWGDTDIEWSIEGFNGYDTATAPEVIGNAMNAQLLNIPSKTYLTEIKTKAALATVPEASQQTKEVIRQEIKQGVEDEEDILNLFGANNAQANSLAELKAEQASANGAASGSSGGSKSAKKPKGKL